MRDYSVGRGLMSLIEVVCWIGVLIGIGVAFTSMGAATRGFGAAPGIVAAIPGILIGLLSLFGVALTQMGRASIDSAEYGQQSLKVAREQLEVSKQAMKQSQRFEQSFATLVQKSTEHEQPTPIPETSKPSYANGQAKAKTIAAPTQETAEEPLIDGDTLTYRGQTGKLKGEKWYLNGIAFQTQEQLIGYIDKIRGKPALVASRNP